MLYMVIEHFKQQDAVPVYRRFQEKGRMTPEGLEYVSSWVDMKLERCFQVMETSDPKLMFEWIGSWNDLVDFEVVPVMSSEDAVQTVRSKL
jgi:hypothetical protein